MLFRKKLPRCCSYCANATQVNADEVLCIKRGVVSIDHGCRKFEYDPCKRIPAKPKAPDFTKYDTDDFSL